MQKVLLFTAYFLLLNSLFAQAQSTIENKDLVQFSGVVMEADSIQPVFYATIHTKGTSRGTSSDLNGFFSFVAKKGDTITISALGYQATELLIPKTLEENKYSVIQFMEKDTILLPAATVYPWPKPIELKEVFLSIEIPDDDLQRARRNLDREKMRELEEVLAMDGRENFKFQSQQYAQRQYYAGQYPPMNILNPFAWVEFFKALKRGDFKKKKKKRKK